MYDNGTEIYEQVEALHHELMEELETARLAASALLSVERSPRASSPIAHSQWRRALITESTTAGVLRRVCDDLAEIVAAYEVTRAADDSARRSGVIHSSRRTADEEPQPSDPVP